MFAQSYCIGWDAHIRTVFDLLSMSTGARRWIGCCCRNVLAVNDESIIIDDDDDDERSLAERM